MTSSGGGGGGRGRGWSSARVEYWDRKRKRGREGKEEEVKVPTGRTKQWRDLGRGEEGRARSTREGTEDHTEISKT
jgi:hypothetical protein